MKQLQILRLLPICTFLMALMISFSVACKDDDDDGVDCSGITPTYNSEVKAILDTSCAYAGCHDAATAQMGVNLSTYASARVVSQEERFLAVINHRSGFTAMPYLLPKLPATTIETLTCWVENGSPE